MLKKFLVLAFWILISLITCLGFTRPAFAAEVIEIPDEDLARESVLPIFDSPDVVKNRNVTLSDRMELGAFVGTNVNEAFFDQILYGGLATYHLSETSALQVLFSLISATSSQYVPQLNEVSTPPLRYELLPKPKYFFLASYEYTPIYGKISITKQSVLNLTTYVTLGAGMFALGDSQTPVIGIGLGQNFFFGKSWGIKLDMKGLIYQGIDPVSVDVNAVGTTPSVSAFKKQTMLNFTVGAGLVFLL